MCVITTFSKGKIFYLMQPFFPFLKEEVRYFVSVSLPLYCSPYDKGANSYLGKCRKSSMSKMKESLFSSWYSSYVAVTIILLTVLTIENSEAYLYPQQCLSPTDVATNSNNRTPTTLFGTCNGFDVGGARPVCWGTSYSNMSSVFRDNLDSQDPTDLVWMNQRLVNPTFASTRQFRQFAYCLPRTNFSTNAQDVDFQTEFLPYYFQESNATFSLDLHIDLVEYEAFFENKTPGGVAFIFKPDQLLVWYRIMKCRSFDVGYCQPFLDSQNWESYLDEDTIDSKDFDYQQGTALPMESTDPGNNNFTFATQWIATTLQRVSYSSYFGSVNVTAHVLESTGTGVHHFIAHGTVLMHLAENDTLNETAFRVDIAGSFGVFGVSPTPYIQRISEGTKIFVAVIIAICGLGVSVMMGFVIMYRNHRLMMISQAGFLVWLCFTSLVLILFSFLILPTRDIFCQLSNLLFIPGTMLPAIVVGRIWRSHTALSVANRLGQARRNSSTRGTILKKFNQTNEQVEKRVMKVLSWIAFSRVVQNNGRRIAREATLRQVTTRRDTVKLILMLCMPQIILQLVNVFVSTHMVEIVYSENLYSGRQSCDSQEGVNWSLYAGASLLACNYFLALFVAYCSRHLPSAFNEKDRVFRSTFINCVASVALLALVSFFDIADTDPNIAACLTVSLIILLAVVTTSYIVIPKIRRGKCKRSRAFVLLRRG
jgi:hypothetical protein